MEWLFKISNSIKHGKFLSLVKPILNVIFVSSITYYCMIGLYSNINVPSRFQLKEVIEYFLNGNFIIPLCIFVLIWSITSYGFGTFFEYINLHITEKLRNKLLSFTFIKSLGKSKSDPEFNQLLEITKTPKKDWIMIIFERAQQKIDPKKATEIKQKLLKTQEEYTSDFVLIFRILIAITIYKFALPEYNIWLFLILLLILFVCAILLILGYQLAALLPIVAAQMNKEYEIRKRQEKLINP